jgi:hypothetical protein
VLCTSVRTLQIVQQFHNLHSSSAVRALKQKIKERAETEAEMWTDATRQACKFVPGEMQKRCLGENKRWLPNYIKTDFRKIRCRNENTERRYLGRATETNLTFL